MTHLSCITPTHIREFYENAGHGGPRRSYGSTLRVFFRWAAVQGLMADSLGDAVPRPRQYRHVDLPDVLSQAEVDRILAAVDQSTALGRRDYAILLLAARYGLRPCDIRQLTLDDIDWRAGRIDLRQLKTGRPLVLPLLIDVAHALSEYIRDGRPVSSDRTIFLRHCAPFEPFAPENNLNENIRGALKRAGLAARPGRRGCTSSATRLPHGCWLLGVHSKQSLMSWAMLPPKPHMGMLGSTWQGFARWRSPKRRSADERASNSVRFWIRLPISTTASAVPRPKACSGLPLSRGRSSLARPGSFSEHSPVRS